MAHITQTQLHRVYQVRQHGDTLVVTPKGDAAGFSLSSVNTELQVVQSLLDCGASKHLVIDLSSGNYFGSVVLGALIQLGQTVRQQGGRIAMAAPSSDMQDILRLMKLDQMWELFPDLRSALRSIARIPVGDRLWARRYWFVGLILVLAGLAVYPFLPRWRYGRSEYRVLKELWQDVESRRKLAGTDEWRRLEQRSKRELEPILEHLESTMKRRRMYDAEPFVLYAIRDHWQNALDRNPASDVHETDRRLVQFYLRCAEAALEGRPLPTRYDQVEAYPASTSPPVSKGPMPALELEP